MLPVSYNTFVGNNAFDRGRMYHFDGISTNSSHISLNNLIPTTSFPSLAISASPCPECPVRCPLSIFYMVSYQVVMSRDIPTYTLVR